MKITPAKKAEKFSLGTKRLHLPGVVVTDNCPDCGREASVDLGKVDHLSYPEVNAPCKVFMVCEKCECEWQPTIILRLTVEPA